METSPQPLPTGSSSMEPKAVYWFRIYAIAMTAMYALCFLLGVIFLIVTATTHGEERIPFLINGILFAVISTPFAIACGASLFLPRKPWVWVYDLVIICIGLTSCCTMPACIPLLIYWLKPEVKTWFNRGA